MDASLEIPPYALKLVEYTEKLAGVKALYELSCVDVALRRAVRHRFQAVLDELERMGSRLSDHQLRELEEDSLLQRICCHFDTMGKCDEGKERLRKLDPAMTPYIDYLSERKEATARLNTFLDRYHFYLRPKVTPKGVEARCLFLNWLEPDEELPEELLRNSRTVLLKVASWREIGNLERFWSLRSLKELILNYPMRELSSSDFLGFSQLVELDIHAEWKLERLELRQLAQLQILKLSCVSSAPLTGDLLPPSLTNLSLANYRGVAEFPDLRQLNQLRKVWIYCCEFSDLDTGNLPESVRKLEVNDKIDRVRIRKLPRLEALTLCLSAKGQSVEVGALPNLCAVIIGFRPYFCEKTMSDVMGEVTLPSRFTPLMASGQLLVSGEASLKPNAPTAAKSGLTALTVHYPDLTPQFLSYLAPAELASLMRVDRHHWKLATQAIQQRWREFLTKQGCDDENSFVCKDTGITRECLNSLGQAALSVDDDSTQERLDYLSRRLSLRKFLWCLHQPDWKEKAELQAYAPLLARRPSKEVLSNALTVIDGNLPLLSSHKACEAIKAITFESFESPEGTGFCLPDLSMYFNLRELNLVDLSLNGIGSLEQLRTGGLLTEFRLCQLKGLKELPSSLCLLRYLQTLELSDTDVDNPHSKSVLFSLPRNVTHLIGSPLSPIELDEWKMREIEVKEGIYCAMKHILSEQVFLPLLDSQGRPKALSQAAEIGGIKLSRSSAPAYPLSALSLCCVDRITALDLSHNYFNGFPMAICALQNLRGLVLRDVVTESDGSLCLPLEITGWKKLATLDLSENHLQGQSLRSLGDLLALCSIDLSNSRGSLSLPDGVRSLKELKSVNLKGCNLRSIPDVLWYLPSSTTIALERNSIPSHERSKFGNRWLGGYGWLYT